MKTAMLKKYKLTILSAVAVAGMALAPVIDVIAAVTYLGYGESITCKSATVTGGKHTVKGNADGTVTITCTSKKKQVKVDYQ